jgi:hypothetical protein
MRYAEGDEDEGQDECPKDLKLTFASSSGRKTSPTAIMIQAPRSSPLEKRGRGHAIRRTASCHRTPQVRVVAEISALRG